MHPDDDRDVALLVASLSEEERERLLTEAIKAGALEVRIGLRRTEG